MELGPEFDLAHTDATSLAVAVKAIAEVRQVTVATLSYVRRSLPITRRSCDLLGYGRTEGTAVTVSTSKRSSQAEQ